MNDDRVVLVDKLLMVYVLRVAGLAAENRSRAENMVRVGRWSSTLVRESLVERQRMRSEESGLTNDHHDHAHMPEMIVNHSRRGRGEVKSTGPHVWVLKDVWKSSASVPMARETSARISEVLNRCAVQVPNLEEFLSSLGKDDVKISNEGHLSIDWIRCERCKEIGSLIGKEAVDGEPINDGTYSSSIRGHLFHSWDVAVNDPSAAMALWIFEVAPSGILRGIYPPSDHRDLEAAPHTDFEGFVNYKGVDTEPEASNTILGHREALEEEHFKDAFWLIPLRASERKNFVGLLFNK